MTTGNITTHPYHIHEGVEKEDVPESFIIRKDPLKHRHSKFTLIKRTFEREFTSCMSLTVKVINSRNLGCFLMKLMG